MSEKPTIFISYGHDEFKNFVLKVAEDLRAKGLYPWIDYKDIKPSVTWYQEIKHAIDRSEIIIAFLTEHSVREDGFCVNELLYALQKTKRVLPVKIQDVETPIFMLRIQWLDIRSIYKEYQNSSMINYEAFIDDLVNDILGRAQLKLLDFDNPIRTKLIPVDNESFLFLNKTDFVDRQWLIDLFDSWANHSDKKYLVIYGKPGSGKSTFVTQLMELKKSLSAVHYCIHGHDDRILPHRVIMSIAYHLSTQHSEYHSLLKKKLVNIPNLLEISYSSLFEHLILTILWTMQPPENKMIIVIDGLDEAKYNGRNLVLDLLIKEFVKTPGWVRVVVTSRPEPEILRGLSMHDSIRLDLENAHYLDDMKKYAKNMIGQHENHAITESMLERIIEQSDQNYIYLRELLKMTVVQKSDLNELPKQISSLYLQYMDRIVQSNPTFNYSSDVRPIFEIILAAYQALTLDFLSIMLDRNPYEVEDILEAFSFFIEIHEGKLNIIHKTMRDWLIDRRRSDQYYVRVSQGNRNWLNFLMKNHDSVTYATLYLSDSVRHAILSRNIDIAVRLLNDLDFFNKRTASLGLINALLAYVNEISMIKNADVDILEHIIYRETFKTIVTKNRDLFLNRQLISMLDDINFGSFVKKEIHSPNIHVRIVNLRYLRFKGDYAHTYNYAIECIDMFKSCDQPIPLSKLYQFAALSTYYYGDYKMTKFYLEHALKNIESLARERLDYLTLRSFHGDCLLNSNELEESKCVLEDNVAQLIDFKSSITEEEILKLVNIQIMDAKRCLIKLYSFIKDFSKASKHLDDVLELDQSHLIFYEDYPKFKIIEMFYRTCVSTDDEVHKITKYLKENLRSDYHVSLFHFYRALGMFIREEPNQILYSEIDKGLEVAKKRNICAVIEKLLILQRTAFPTASFSFMDMPYLKHENRDYYKTLQGIFMNMR